MHRPYCRECPRVGSAGVPQVCIWSVRKPYQATIALSLRDSRCCFAASESSSPSSFVLGLEAFDECASLIIKAVYVPSFPCEKVGLNISLNHAHRRRQKRKIICENYILPRIGEIGYPDQCARAGLLGDWRTVLGGRNPCRLGQSR